MEEPVVVENNFAQNLNNNTGFPFDDSDYDSNDHFQSRLNDIASRHPEFATHFRLDDFPSLRRKRQPAEDTSHSPGTSSGSGSRFPGSFSRFPFTDQFDEEDFQHFGAQKPPEVPKQETGKRGRRPNPNLPQHLSNTVDLGQKQPSVAESRNQRSMSAPPENRTSSSRVEQDFNPPEDMGKNYSRQNQPPPNQAPKERIIPIHVEGRDDPVMPKNPNTPTEKAFGGEKVHTGYDKPFAGPEKSFSGRQSDPHAQYRRQMYDQYVPKQQFQQTQPPNQQNQHNFARQQTPPQQQFPRQQTPPHQTKEASPRQQATPPPMSNDPLDKIKSVRSDVMELMTQVEQFAGTRKDKDYLYLDEMLTRNLLKLDDIETEGKENIRLARKEAIKCIQTCISNLEAKAQAKELYLKSEKNNSQNETSQETTANQLSEEQLTPKTSKSEENVPQSAPDQKTKETSPPKFTSQATLIISPPQKQQKIEDQPTDSAPKENEKMEVEETNSSDKTTENQMETEEKTNEASQTK